MLEQAKTRQISPIMGLAKFATNMTGSDFKEVHEKFMQEFSGELEGGYRGEAYMQTTEDGWARFVINIYPDLAVAMKQGVPVPPVLPGSSGAIEIFPTGKFA